MLDIYKLQNQYLSLRARSRSAARVTETEGYELGGEDEKESSSAKTKQVQVEALGKEWRTWQLASLKNLYLPLSNPRRARY